jgi:hypothetical protein
MNNYSEYQNYLLKKQAKEDKLSLFAKSLSLFITLFFLLYQSLFGFLSNNPLSFITTVFTSIAITITVIFTLLKPNTFYSFIFRQIERVSKPLSTIISSFFLALIYTLSFPIARVFRYKLKNSHPSTYRWLEGGDITSTWRLKHIKPMGTLSRFGLFATLQYFIQSKNYFLLIISVLLIIISVVMFLSASPVISPFIYPIF